MKGSKMDGREKTDRNADREAVGSEQRADRLQLLARVGQRTAAILDLDVLLRESVHLIQTTFQYYFVDIFLVDGPVIALQATTLESLERIKKDIRLQIGKQGITGWVAANGKPLLVPDVRQEPRYYRTIEAEMAVRSELAVPIRLMEKVIGVLDVQSIHRNAFSELDTFTLQAVADQLAVAIENARLYGELRRELSERRRAEEDLERSLTELRSTQEQLLQSQKMEAIGKLAGGVAHDFNNLLMAILGNAEMAADELGPESPVTVYLAEIRKAAESAAQLTRQLLAFSRKQILQPRVLNLNALVSDMEGMLRRLIGENIALRLSLDPEAERVKADPAQIQQVVMNLVVNARDAMPEGGTLSISTANATMGDEAARAVALTVSDAGVGMDRATMQLLFEPFFTTKGIGRGTGLGLSTVYGIVRQSGGQIGVESEPGKGSTFRVLLPAVSGLPPLEQAQVPSAAPPAEGATVLVAEDEPAVRNLLHDSLTAAGYRVLDASNAAEALQTAGGCREPIRLLITDVVMPGDMNGRDLAARLQRERPGIRVLFVSGYAPDDADLRESLGSGRSYLAKPFRPAELRRAVEALLAAT
jgi:two-component system, cell cycle sensor histidine kinase and response regulator CckA